MAHRAPTPHATHHRALVFGVAAIVLVVAMVSQNLPQSQQVAHLVSREYAARMDAERAGAIPDECLTADMSPTIRVPPTPPVPTAISGSTTLVAPCSPHFDFDHDLRLVLSAMALQGRRFALERPAGHYGNRGKQYVPTQISALALAAEAVWLVRAEASPPAARRPDAPGC